MSSLSAKPSPYRGVVDGVDHQVGCVVRAIRQLVGVLVAPVEVASGQRLQCPELFSRKRPVAVLCGVSPLFGGR